MFFQKTQYYLFERRGITLRIQIKLHCRQSLFALSYKNLEKMKLRKWMQLNVEMKAIS